ncbi:MAG: mechanosensitive ion channel family protein [Gemmatimonadaceae bacterium]
MNVAVTQAWTTIQQLIDGFFASAPRFLLAIIIVALFYFAGKGVRSLVRHHVERRQEPGTLEIALGRLAQTAMVVLGILIAVTAAFPTFTPANLVSALGIGGVAIGFAFKDIFQNFLAGILILITKPFRVGDQIIFNTYEGVVEQIQTRATYIKTYDGRRIVLPNSDLYTNPVTVNTAFAQRRVQYDIGIGYGDDIEQAKQIILKVLHDAEGVDPDPKADVIVVNLAGSSVNLRARWWSNSRIVDVLLGQDKVLTEVKNQLQANGIDLPYPTRQILFHDQSEQTDGDRRKQREGWPAGNKDVPVSRSIAGAVAAASPASPAEPDDAHKQ